MLVEVEAQLAVQALRKTDWLGSIYWLNLFSYRWSSHVESNGLRQEPPTS